MNLLQTSSSPISLPIRACRSGEASSSSPCAVAPIRAGGARLSTAPRQPAGRPFAPRWQPRRRPAPETPHALPALASIFEQAWGPSPDINGLAQAVSSNLFALSLFPYIGFLYHLTRSKQTPPLALFGFYFLLVFVFATIPAGIVAKTQYGASLANVDMLHGSAESLLTITNLLVVLGFRRGIREAEARCAEGGAGEAAADGGREEGETTAR